LYAYTKDLLELESERRKPPKESVVPAIWGGVESPLVISEWERCLEGHPDRSFAEYLVRGMRNGFRVGFPYTERRCVQAKNNNMKSTMDNLGVKAGRVVGPLELAAAHVNRIGVIPMNHQPGKWQLIV